MISLRLRVAAAGSAVALLLAFSFPDSIGLWPLRLAAAWPAEIGRALGNLFTSGRFETLALGQGPALNLYAPSVAGRALAAALGLAFGIGAAAGLLWLSQRPPWPRRLFALLAVAATIAALIPPVSFVSAAELGLALACALLAVIPEEGPRVVALVVLAGTAGTAPLADLRPAFLDIGRASGAVATLEAATGISATALALVVFGFFVAAVAFLFRDRPSIPHPDPAEPAKTP